ncbi:MAG: hypothetical protein AUH01_01590 [Acidobacteria bacterium 13_2_20CM_56_17]|nr:MAG: hypothetical protein AUH01_01590 [Acidobacteria bacterium 13_2_20CM_56_17]
MSLKIGELISTFLCALVTGVFWGPWLGLSLSIATFKPEVFLAIGHRMIGNLAPVMPFLMPAATLSIIPVLVLSFNQHQQTFYLTLAGFLLFIAALLVTLIVEVPIDNQIKTWTIATLPNNWEQLRDPWEKSHVIRTASIAGLALLLIAAIL